MTNNITVTANAECFVIPNRASNCENYVFGKAHREDNVRAIVEASGETFDVTNDQLIQLWITSDELHSDNIECHGFHTMIDGEDVYCHLPSYSSCLPKQVLPKAEGVTKRIVIPRCTAETSRRWLHDNPEAEEKEFEFTLILNLTANQKSYRYRSFGNFEDTRLKFDAVIFYLM